MGTKGIAYRKRKTSYQGHWIVWAINDYRIEQGYRLKDLAKILNCGESTIGMLLAGSRKQSTLSLVERILDHLGYELQIVKKEE